MSESRSAADWARPDSRNVEARIRINPIDCKAHGLCAEILPEWVELDEWGYPILAGEALPDDLLAHARRAARSCPTLAIVLRED